LSSKATGRKKEVKQMTAPYPDRFIREFMKNPRLVPKPGEGGTNGTRPVDLRIFKSAIQDVLSNKAFMQEFANAIIKKGQFTL
jgi:hypothetical protein